MRLDDKIHYEKRKPRLSIKNIVLGLSIIVTLIFIVFGFIQKTEADIARSNALEILEIAEKDYADAKAQQERMATQIKTLEEQLKACAEK